MKKKPRHLRSMTRTEPDLPEVVELSDMSDANVRAAFIVRFGPQCAGWLCARFRRTIRKLGTFIVHIPEGKELPAWFDIAICYLEKHAKRWAVTRNVIRGVRYFRVFYTPKRKPTPIAIVPVGQS
jgi:hypothetical protein